MVTKFRSAEAETAWNKFRELWRYTNPNSTNYAFMQEPLQSEEVWRRQAVMGPVNWSKKCSMPP